MKIRLIFSLAAALAQTACAESSVWDQPTADLGKPVAMTVYRSPSCGCCGKWIAHMKKQGFLVKDLPTEDMDAVKRRLGVPQALQSCHTAVVDGHTVEGHVPAGDVKKLLQSKTTIAGGLAAPGMPAGSPGMEMGGAKANFSVILFDQSGKTDTFNTYSNH
ncbi:MAG: DUF411 domain-containing protein [Candidatus Methylumidiphilus sp.]